MSRRLPILLFVIAILCTAVTPVAAQGFWGAKGYKAFLIGDPQKPREKAPQPGLMMAGGGEWPVDAFHWFADKTGHGHVVVLRASGTTSTADEMYKQIGGFASIRTFVFTDRKASSDPELLDALKKADGIFLAGGDQANYVRFWKGTPVEAALNAHVAAGKPLGGTSAGLAVQGEYVYGAMDGGSIGSEEALKDPLGAAVTMETDFLRFDLLKGIVTDTHFKERKRQGRLVTFLAKAQHMAGRPLTGIGVDEQTVLAVNGDGSTQVYSNIGGYAWVFEGVTPRDLKAGTPLSVDNIKVTGLDKDSTFNVLTRQIGHPAFVKRYTVNHGVMREKKRWALAIHGGAGVIEREKLSPEKEAHYRAGLSAALSSGQAVLDKGGTAVDAVEATLRVLEDNPLFNAGKGAVFTADGVNELDAAIMDGATQKAGAVAGVTRTKNPVSLARAVMEKSPHVLLARDGADRFSVEKGLEQVDPKYFFTQPRWDQLQAWKARNLAAVDQTHLFGTVGAVALDQDGHLAAATSTGGTTGKRWGRVGDSPIIGAGTYAKDGACAVSATGTGEYFIRESAARQVCDRVLWKGQTIAEAAQDTIMAVGAIGGDGGLIAMDAAGEVAFGLNDLGMYRGTVSAETPVKTAIFADEK
ncbi:isoaspartyl peptidase/L-asparaginase [Asticcacaulis currens]